MKLSCSPTTKSISRLLWGLITTLLLKLHKPIFNILTSLFCFAALYVTILVCIKNEEVRKQDAFTDHPDSYGITYESASPPISYATVKVLDNQCEIASGLSSRRQTYVHLDGNECFPARL